MLSAVVITSNAKDTIGSCIDALLKVTSDIVIIDSGSNDGTREICLSKSIRYYFRKWEGYSANKNFGNSLAVYDHILSIDSDEILSDKLIYSIKQEFSTHRSNLKDAYYINFLTWYCGRWIRYGDWNPNWHVRIFNRNMVEWREMDVHELLSVTSNHQTKRLEGYILHYSYPTQQRHLDKIEKYTDLFAERSFKAGKKSGIFRAYVSSVFAFFSNYFLRAGFLDGYFGLIVARNSAYYTFLKYKKLSKRYS